MLADLLRSSRERTLSADEAAREDSLAVALGRLEESRAVLQRDAQADTTTTGEVRALADETRGRLLAMEAEWSAFQAELAGRHSGAQEQIFDLRQVQAALPGDAALLGWLDVGREGGEFASWGYAARSSGPVQWARIATSGVDEQGDSPIERARAFRDEIAGAGALRIRARMTPRLRDRAHRLWKERLAPLAGALDGVGELAVVPSGAMLGVPVESLIHAFFQAGARSVLVSLWQVSDEATAHLMRRFYENRQGAYEDERGGRRATPMSKADALREAKHWLRTQTDEAGRRPFEHPYYWAGFVLFGESR